MAANAKKKRRRKFPHYFIDVDAVPQGQPG
jgi:hypothetical protein